MATVVAVREAEPIAAALAHLDEVGKEVVLLIGPTIAIERRDFGRREHTSDEPEIVQRSPPGITRGTVIQTAADTQATAGLEDAGRTRRLPREHAIDVDALLTGRRLVGADDEIPFALPRTHFTRRDARAGARGIAREC